MTDKLKFDKSTNTLTVSDNPGVEYLIGQRVVRGEVKLTRDTVVRARPVRGKTFEKGAQTQWKFEVSETPSEDPSDGRSDESSNPPAPASPASTPATAGNPPESPGQAVSRAAASVPTVRPNQL